MQGTRTAGRRRAPAIAALLASALALLVWATAAQAATITVNTTADNAPSGSECSGAPGDCSLRQAVDKASSGDTITVPASSSPYAVSSDQITLDKSITIAGAGARSTVLDASGGTTGHRIFYLHTTGVSVTLSGLTLTGGSPSGEGGAIYLDDGSLAIADSEIRGNTPTAEGGGIYLDGGALTIDRSAIVSNHAGSHGGGLDLDDGTADITNTTIADNKSDEQGGAIDTDSTGPFNLTNVTVARNFSASASDNSGGFSDDGHGLHLQNTIVAFNTTPDGNHNCEQTPASLGNNLDTDGTCFATGGTDIPNVDAKLSATGDHGGPTDTDALLPGSPAIDAGATIASVTVDQRGVARPQPAGGRFDIGAYEFALPVAVTGDATGITTSGATISGSVTPLPSATVSFQYGTTTAYGSTTPAQTVSSGNAASTVSAALGGLAAGTTYHYRVVATNPDGTALGADRTFTTASPPPPVVSPSHRVRCTVPKLRGRTLRQARRLLTRHHCRLGRVNASAAARRRGRLVVARSSPRAGRVLAAGARVSVTLRSTRPAATHRAPRFTG